MLLPTLLLSSLAVDAPVTVAKLEAIEVDAASTAAVQAGLVAALVERKVAAKTAEEEVAAAARGQQSAAGFLLSGSLGRVGDQWVLGLSLADLRSSVVVARAGASATSLDELAKDLGGVVDELLRPKHTVQPSVELRKNPVFVILELKGAGLPDERARNLVQVVANELRRIEGARVLSRDEVQAMLGAENLRQVLDASCDRSCFARLAGALDADYIVTGSIGVLAETYVISLTALDQRSDGRAQRVTETYQGSADELLRATRHATQVLFGLAQGAGALSVGATEGGAILRLDEREIGALPLPPQDGLVPGKYAVTLEKSGYAPWRSEIYVNPEDTTVLWAALERLPEEWYEKWWVWTLVGVAVAGSTAGIVAAASVGSPDSGTVAVQIR